MKNLLEQIQISEEKIKEKAYGFWAKGNKDQLENWLKAEKQLKIEFLKEIISPVVQELYGKVEDFSEGFDSSVVSAISTHLQDSDIKDDQIIGDGLRYYRNYGDEQLLIIEESPKVRTLYIDTRFNNPKIGSKMEGYYDKSEENSRPIALGLPYVIYIIKTNSSYGKFHYSKMDVGFSNISLKSLKQKIHVPLLPNMSLNWLCCRTLSSEQSSPFEVAKDVITQFWQSQFNYMLFRPDALPPELETFEKWAKSTAENPLFVLNIKWPTASFDLMNYLGKKKLDGIQKVITNEKITFLKKVLSEISDLQQSDEVVKYLS